MHFFTLATTSASGSADSASTWVTVLLTGVQWLALIALIFVARNWFRKRKNRTAARAIANGSEWPDGVSAEFVGGMNVPSRLGGRLNATVPLVRLTISGSTVRMDPRGFASVMFTGFEVPLREIASAFPLRGTFMTAGVGLELSDGQLAYFWTLGDTSQVLGVLGDRGVSIGLESRRARGAVSGQFGLLLSGGQGPSPSRVAGTPGYSPLMLRLMPIMAPLGIVLGTVIFVLFVLQGTAFGFFGAVIAAIGVLQAIRRWRGSRKATPL